MTGTDDTLTISRGAVVCRLEGFGAAPEALRALAAYFAERVALGTERDGALPVPDPVTLARLVDRDVARRITVDAAGGAVVLRLRGADEEEAEKAAPRAPSRIRVVKAPRAEVEAARAAGLFGATAAATEGGATAAGPEGTLSDEDEAALQRELDRVDDELGRSPPPRGAGASAPGRAAPETALIFARADSRMSESVLRQRCSAHRHLRAALAANRADTVAGRAPDAVADDTPYRGDLAAAQGDDPLPPLRLEQSQRVDPGRAVSGTERAGVGEESFSAFAQEMGATTLPDRLEAAAAWLADVRGRAAFPRAMLLETLSEADGVEPPLDEALQACARMLRAGRLRARPGGALAPTDTTRFRGASARCGGPTPT